MKKLVLPALFCLLIAGSALAADAVPQASTTEVPICEVANFDLQELDRPAVREAAGECPVADACEHYTGCQTQSCSSVDTNANFVCDGAPFCAGGESVHIVTCICEDAPGEECTKLAVQFQDCQ